MNIEDKEEWLSTNGYLKLSMCSNHRYTGCWRTRLITNSVRRYTLDEVIDILYNDAKVSLFQRCKKLGH